MTEQTRVKRRQRWVHTYIGRCPKHGSIQTAVRTSTNGIGPSLPLEERYPGEFCIRCYLELAESERSSDG